MKPILCMMIFLLAALAGEAQYYLTIKNTDTEPITVSMKAEHKIFQVSPGDTSIKFNVNPLHENVGYTIRSTRGKFDSDASGTLLPAGNYIVVIMWNSKNNFYRTVLRLKTEAD